MNGVNRRSSRRLKKTHKLAPSPKVVATSPRRTVSVEWPWPGRLGAKADAPAHGAATT
jgi:hypothetical protein